MKFIPNTGEFYIVEHTRLSDSVAVFIAITGLSDGHAEIGGTVGFVSNIGQAPDGGIKWSNNPDPNAAALYGTEDVATDFSAGDGESLYLHVTHEGVTYSKSAFIRQAVAPSIVMVPMVTGSVITGAVLSGVAATFDGPAINITHVWEDSPNGVTDWMETNTIGLISPDLVESRFYRLKATATNTKGSTQAVSDSVGPVIADTSTVPSVSIQSIAIGVMSGRQIPVTITATGAQNGDAINWSLAPSGGGADVANGSGTWPNLTATLPADIGRGTYSLTVSVSDSDDFDSNPFTVDTTAGSLTSPTATENADDIDWSVTSPDTQGTIYAALRLASDGVLSITNIENGTGNAVDTNTDASPTAGANNGGTFTAPANGTYRVDMFKRDDFGNETAVVSSGDVVVSAGFTDPNSLGSDLMFWLDFSDGSNIFEDQAATNPVENGDTILAINDKGVNGNHFSVASSSNTWDETNGQMTLGGSTNGVIVSTKNLSNNPTAAELWVAIKITQFDGAGILAYGDTTGLYVARWQDGSGSNTYNIAAEPIYYDKAEVVMPTPTRGQLYTEYGSHGDAFVLRISGLNLVELCATGKLALFGYGSDAAFAIAGAITQSVCVDRPLTAGEVTDLSAWMNARLPV